MDDHRDPSANVLEDELRHPAALRSIEQDTFSGRPQDEESVHAPFDQEIDVVLQRGEVGGLVLTERCDQRTKDPSRSVRIRSHAAKGTLRDLHLGKRG